MADRTTGVAMQDQLREGSYSLRDKENKEEEFHGRYPKQTKSFWAN